LKKKLLILFGGLALVGIGAIAAFYAYALLKSDDVNLATEAPKIAGADIAPTNAAGAGVFHFVIDPAGSKATYVVREKLSALPASSNAVGETSVISGDLWLTPEGLNLTQKSQFKVDLRTLRSDESRRDGFITGTTLQANRFPFAEFVIEAVTGFPANYVEGQEVPLILTGTMTIRQVAKPLTFQVKARRAGDTLTAIADTDFKMTDFGLTPPDIPFLVKAEDGVHLQVVIKAKQAS
jgi:polyisoprenoid-binding protein YceI